MKEKSLKDYIAQFNAKAVIVKNCTDVVALIVHGRVTPYKVSLLINKEPTNDVYELTF